MYFVAGVYMRLSKEDGRRESLAIDSQRKLIAEYTKRNNIKVYKEYIDDGYSGTNFKRPAFKNMLDDIEKGLINMVITKDLSRLGRDYIQTGQYTEIYFPGHSIRYVAVNDDYDSFEGNDDMLPFKNVVNEMYARDISKKICSAFYGKMSDGQFIGSKAPYGYKRSAENKNKLEIDENTYKNVITIFNLKMEGKSSNEIAKYLNENKISSPKAYREGREEYLWCGATIRKILKNQVYIGNLEQGKTKRISFKNRISKNVPKEFRIVVENTHKPIVSKEIFYAINHK